MKTIVTAENGNQNLLITREFDLPVESLFQAHVDPELIVQWMSNPYATAKLVKFEPKKHGSYHYESVDAAGKVVFNSHGVFHDIVPNTRIIRTFEMENGPFGIVLEFSEFESLGANKSRLTIHGIYESAAKRDELLKMPFREGMNMAHDKIQVIGENLK